MFTVTKWASHCKPEVTVCHTGGDTFLYNTVSDPRVQVFYFVLCELFTEYLAICIANVNVVFCVRLVLCKTIEMLFLVVLTCL